MKKDKVLNLVYFFVVLGEGLLMTLGTFTLAFWTFPPPLPGKRAMIEGYLCPVIWVVLSIYLAGSIWLIYQHCKQRRRVG
jgi:hypothetical protein